MRKFAKYFLITVNVFLALLLCCCLAIPVISPDKFWFMGILGLATPYITIANILCAIFWLFSGKWQRSFISLFALLITWKIFSVGFAFGNKNINLAIDTSKSLKVLSYNVRLMDLYKWTGKKDTRKNILDFISDRQPDILCLQEFFSSGDSNGIRNVQDIAQQCNLPYFVENKNFTTKRGFFGDVIFSKYPIIADKRVPLNEQNTKGFHFAEINYKGKTVRVFNLHLQSIKFSNAEKDFINDAENGKQSGNLSQGKIIVQKLKISSAKRGIQAEKVHQYIEESKLPTIVCGDFNDIPSTYTYFKVRGQLGDAFLEKGRGLGTTFNGLSPVLRIDNILFSSTSLKTTNFEIHKKEFSDHYAVEADFQVI